MAPVVSVRKVAEEIDGLPSEATAYLNRQSGDVFSMTELEENIVERADEGEELVAWEREALPQIREVLESDDWLVLPSQRDIHMGSIMRDFAYSITEPELHQQLLHAIHGSKAFSHFKDAVYQRGIQEQWYQYKAHAIEQIVVDWLDDHEIAYTHDDHPHSPAAEP